MELTRRKLLQHTKAGLILAGIGGQLVWTTAAEAVEQGGAFRSLNFQEAAWLSALGEAIAPPSRLAGLAHYIDHHLSVPAAESLLAVRYLDVPPPYAEFYRAALSSMAEAFGIEPPPKDDPRWETILGQLATPGAIKWSGPPSPLFLFAARLDALDIAYGTVEGFGRLGIDYLAHIEPETAW